MGPAACVQPVVVKWREGAVADSRVARASAGRMARCGALGFVMVVLAGNHLALVIDYPGYLEFLEQHVSPDQQIARPRMALVRFNAVLALVAGLLVAAIVNARSVWAAFARTSFVNQAGYAMGTLLIATDVVAWHRGYQYVEDGVLETFTAVAAVVAAALLVGSYRRSTGRAPRTARLSLALLCLFLGGEEISWGQRIFSWPTPAAFASVNFQGETNVHNLFTPQLQMLMDPFELCLGILLCGVSRISATGGSSRRTRAWAGLVPSREFIPYGVVFLVLAGPHMPFSAELTEALCAGVGLAYALSQFLMLKTPRR